MKRRRLISLILLLLIAAASPVWSGWIMDGLAQVMANRWSECELRQVEYEGLRYLTSDSLELAGEFPYGESLFEIDYSALQQNLLALPWVKEASLLRRLPDRLQISIVEHEPVATIRSAQIFALTPDAVVLPVPAAEWVWNLPLLTPSAKLELVPGARIDDQLTLDLLQQVVGMREVAPSLWTNLSEIYYHTGEIRATLLEPPVILRMNRVNEHRTWIALRELLQTNFDGLRSKKSVTTIDLRIPGNIIIDSPEIAQLAQESSDV
jgi:hypothetical protein